MKTLPPTKIPPLPSTAMQKVVVGHETSWSVLPGSAGFGGSILSGALHVAACGAEVGLVVDWFEIPALGTVVVDDVPLLDPHPAKTSAARATGIRAIPILLRFR